MKKRKKSLKAKTASSNGEAAALQEQAAKLAMREENSENQDKDMEDCEGSQCQFSHAEDKERTALCEEMLAQRSANKTDTGAQRKKGRFKEEPQGKTDGLKKKAKYKHGERIQSEKQKRLKQSETDVMKQVKIRQLGAECMSVYRAAVGREKRSKNQSLLTKKYLPLPPPRQILTKVTRLPPICANKQVPKRTGFRSVSRQNYVLVPPYAPRLL